MSRLRMRENAWKWTNPEWLDLLQEGSDKKRFQYCLNSDGLVLCMHAIQGHSGGTKVDPALLDERKPFPRRLIQLRALCCPFKIDCREKGCKRRKTNSTLHRFGSLEQYARGRIPERVKATKGTLQEQLGSDP